MHLHRIIYVQISSSKICSLLAEVMGRDVEFTGKLKAVKRVKSSNVMLDIKSNMFIIQVCFSPVFDRGRSLLGQRESLTLTSI